MAIFVVLEVKYLIIFNPFKHDESESNSKMHDRIKGDLEQKCTSERRQWKFSKVAKFRNTAPCTPIC